MLDYTIKVRNFCKTVSIKNRKMGELFKDFSSRAPEYNNQQKFEEVMLSTRRTPAIICREKCIQFAKDHGEGAWEKFSKEVDNITPTFWNNAVMIEALPKAPKTFRVSDNLVYDKLLPANWEVMTHSQKIDFMVKVKHEGFLKFITDSDKRLKSYYEGIREKKDNKLKLYITLFSIPAGSYTDESKKLLKDFVSALNKLGRAKLQYLECSNPDVIEIREIR